MLTHKLYDNKYKIRITSLKKKKQEKNDYLKAKGKKKDEFSMYQMLNDKICFF
jgi:hypothetical protein